MKRTSRGTGRWLAGPAAVAVLLLMPQQSTLAQTGAKAGTPATRAATASTAAVQARPGVGKPYIQVVPATAQTKRGLFAVHQVGDRTLFEIPKSLLGRDILWYVERGNVAVSTDEGTGGAAASLMVRWERVGDKIFVRNLTPSIGRRAGELPTGPAELPTTDQKVAPMERAVAESALAPTMLAFPVAAEGPNGSVVVDVTQAFQQDIPEFALSSVFGSTRIDPNRSYIEKVRTFPRDLIVESYLTAVPVAGGASASVTIKHSLTLLPDAPMRPRLFDNRIGFLTVDFEQYSEKANEGVVNQQFILRYRLEKKDPNAALSEPVKPIVYYVGRSVPEKWRPYFVQGIEDWNVAFEEAGFKNAVVAKIAPTEAEDPDWDPADTRFSVVRWIANPVRNARGPNICDPRTGEILSAHILIWEDVLKICQAWYYTMASASDPRGRKLPLSDELTGRALRYVVSHEVGHTLGLRHNHRASTAYTVAQLRDAAFAAEIGPVASIMSYGRFNYVAQPDDRLSAESLVPRVAPYDLHAIQWGYSPLPASSEKRTLDEWAAMSQSDPTLLFGGEDMAAAVDPNVQIQNIGRERVEASRLGIENLKRAMGYLPDATLHPGGGIPLMATTWKDILNTRDYYLKSVASLIGGTEETRTIGASQPQFKRVDRDRQREAVTFLLGEGLHWDPAFYPPVVIENVQPFNVSFDLRARQRLVLSHLFEISRLAQLGESELVQKPGQAYSLLEYLRDVTAGVFEEATAAGADVRLLRRAVQRDFFPVVEVALAGEKGAAPALKAEGIDEYAIEANTTVQGTDFVAALKAVLADLEPRLTAAAKEAKDPQVAAHWNECAAATKKLLAR